MRRLLLALLLAGYAATFVRLPSIGRGRELDPLDPRGRQVERAIAEGRFEEARPLAEQLGSTYPDSPVAALWLAETYRGLGRSADEARAWEASLRLSGQADEVCPALPRAYQRTSDAARALDAFERCAAAAPDDAERLIDLADAYTAAGRPSDAADALRRAAGLDPLHPRLREHAREVAHNAPGAAP